jgi:hypothetical protein
MRRTLSLALATLALSPVVWPAAGAQGLTSASLRVAPQLISYTLDQNGQKIKVSEMAVPVAFAIPVTTRLNFDVASAFATSTVDASGAKSTISGLTDTQLRLNYTLGEQALVLTVGVNVNSGRYKVAEDQIAAAGQIGNDFLAFPVSSFGNGLAWTGGAGVVHTVGQWNVGLGASMRKSMEFDATDSIHFTPANEIRARLGADREVAGGRMVLGLVYSHFGDDSCLGGTCGTARSTYSSGDRVIGQAALNVPLAEKQLYIGGWLLHHAAGKTVSGDAPAENIENLLVALGFNAGSLFLEPSVEARLWQGGDTGSGSRSGTLAFVGLRSKFNAGSLEISPSVAIAVTGTLKEGTGDTKVSGSKIGVTIRWSKQ